MNTSYPLVTTWFHVDFQDQITGAFQKCTGFGSEHEVIEQWGCGPRGAVNIKIPGNIKWNHITLSKGLTSSVQMWEWLDQVATGGRKKALRNGTITMYNQAGTAIARWEFINAWPVKLTGPSANAAGNEIGIEELEIAHEGYHRVKV